MKKTSIKQHIGIKTTLFAIGLCCAALPCRTFADESPAAPATNKEKEDLLKRDQAAIQGKWKIVSMRAAGNAGPDSIVAVMKYEFKGDQLIITPSEPGQSNYTFKLDPSSKPVANFDMTPLDAKAAEQAMKGIYVLEGDHLKICLGKNNRPAKMSAEAGDGFGQMLIELEREKS